MHLTIDQERMADFFVKHHVRGLPRAAVFHEFSGVDHGDPHDHPFGFTSFIVSGGYTEDVFDLATGEREQRSHMCGQAFFVPAGHIHRIIHMPASGCITLIIPGPHERKPGFYRWEDGKALHRFWDQPDFTPIKAAGQDESRAV